MYPTFLQMCVAILFMIFNWGIAIALGYLIGRIHQKKINKFKGEKR